MAGSAHTWADGDVATAAYMNAIPYGVMGYVVGATSNQASISTVVDITGLTVTFTAISTRLYKTTLRICVSQQTSGGTQTLSITDGANSAKQISYLTVATNDQATVDLILLETGLSGSTTRKGRAATSAGTMTVEGGAGHVGLILVEDLGPA